MAELSAGGGKKRKQTDMTPEQSPVYHAFIAWWTDEAYPQAMQGVVYPFNWGADCAFVKTILRFPTINWDLDRAKRVAIAYLRADQTFLVNQGRTLLWLAKQIQNWVIQAQLPTPQRRQEYYHARNRNERNADGTRPGEHPQPARGAPLAAAGRPVAGSADAELDRDELFQRYGVELEADGPVLSRPAVGTTAGPTGGGLDRRGGGANAA